MKFRQLGKSDLSLSVIGLGTWAIGGDWRYGWGHQEDSDSIAAILEALEHGINWIDTAAVYGFGHSEEVVAKALAEWKDEVIVATKCGLVPKGKAATGCLKRKSIMNEIEASLRRLQRDCIDLYQVHWPMPDEDIEEAIETLTELQQQGKIRHIGVSNFAASQLDRVNSKGNIVSLQPPYSLIKRGIEHDSLLWCRKHELGVICYSPMQCGLLTGKASREWVATLSENDWRKNSSALFKEPVFSAVLAYVDRLRGIAELGGHTVLELSLSWIISQPGVTSAICGARRKGQIVSCIKAASKQLSDEQFQLIESAYQEFMTDPSVSAELDRP